MLPRARLRRFVPSLEQFEPRLVPAVTFKVLDLNGDHVPDLRIIGDAGQQVIEITEGLRRTVVEMDRNGNGLVGDRADKLKVYPMNFGVLDVRLMKGDDRLSATTVGILGGEHRWSFDAGAGNDEITVQVQSVYQASAEIAIDLGVGINRCDVVVEFVDEGDSLDVEVLGGPQADTVALKPRLYPPDQSGNLEAYMYFNGDFSFNAALGAGDDEFAFGGDADFNFVNVGPTASVALSVDVGPGDDELTMPASLGRTFLDVQGEVSVLLMGGDGADSMSVFWEQVQLRESSRLSIGMAGDTGDDELMIGMSYISTESTGEANVQLLGEAGDDVLTLAVFDELGSAITYGPLGAVLMDGGAGVDAALFAFGQNAPSSVVGCEN